MVGQTTSEDGQLVAAVLVPGQPHLADAGVSKPADDLAKAMVELGDRLAARGVERLVYYSTQWISVLGHSFQARSEIAGTHVDENWHGFADLPFHFHIDVQLAQDLAEACSAAGHQTRLLDYEGFPIDTGTIVADSLLNRGRFRTTMVSCCMYSDFQDTVQLARAMRPILVRGPQPTALVCVSSLSMGWFTTDIDRGLDRVSEDSHDRWNRKFLAQIADGGVAQTVGMLADYRQACRVDMGMKALAMIQGMGLGERRAEVHAYGPLYGTGAAVIAF